MYKINPFLQVSVIYSERFIWTNEGTSSTNASFLHKTTGECLSKRIHFSDILWSINSVSLRPITFWVAHQPWTSLCFSSYPVNQCATFFKVKLINFLFIMHFEYCGWNSLVYSTAKCDCLCVPSDKSNCSEYRLCNLTSVLLSQTIKTM